MSFAALESWLRTRRGLLALWLVTTVAVAVVTLLMRWGGVPGWDDAAHAYKVFLLRHGDSVFWDTYWYGGGYGAITYGFVFYWLAQYVPAALIVIVAAGTRPGDVLPLHPRHVEDRRRLAGLGLRAASWPCTWRTARTRSSSRWR